MCLLFCSNVIAAETAANTNDPLGSGPWVVKAYYENWQAVKHIRDMTEPWTINKDEKFMLLEVENLDEYQRFLDLGLTLQVDAALTYTYFQAPLRVSRGGDSIPGFSCYSTVEHSYQRMDDLQTARPDLVEIIDIGDSWEKINLASGYDMRVLKITNSAIAGDKPVLFAMSSIHAREYTPAELLTRYAEFLVNQYGIDADVTWIVDHHEIHLLLQGNPDGRKKAETGLSWRKTTNQDYCGVMSNTRGADMNRNFFFKWGGTGSSGSECSNIYRGPSAVSEPESFAINDYVTSIFPDQRGPNDVDAAPMTTMGVYLDVHSFSEVILWPWGWGAPVNSPNHGQLQTLGRRLGWFNNYEPLRADDFGPAAGASDDNAYGQLGIAAYTFELGTTFFQGCSTFENTILPANLPALMYAARVARTPYLTPSGPDIVSPMLSNSSITPGDLVTLTGLSTDLQFNNNNGSEPTQSISAVNVFVDIPPWENDAIAIPLTAEDGSFDSPSENYVGTLNTTGLAAGRHILYFQATDSLGSMGAVYAQFLTVTSIFADGFESL